MVALPSGFQWRPGSVLDRALLVKFMQRTYQEWHPEGDFSHLAVTVESYFSGETPLWWVDPLQPDGETTGQQAVFRAVPQPAACLWMGTAIDQASGDRHAYIFLIYVLPQYRRQGIGQALMRQAETWAQERGDRQIGLQVFQFNQPALELYRSLGYQVQSYWLVKSLGNPEEGESHLS